MSARGSVALGRIILASSLVVSMTTTTTTRARADDASASESKPPLALSVTAAAGGGPWKLRVENTGELPVRIAADPRLLVLEVTPPAGFVEPATAGAKRTVAPPKSDGAPKAVRCALPEDARPATDEGRELVIPGKRSWSATFDPMLYCFGARERAVLVSGATVTAHFGWPSAPQKAAARPPARPTAAAPPFVASPVGAAIGHIAPAKALEAAPFTLAENVAAAPSLPAPPGAQTLRVTTPETLDVARGTEISTVVTLENPSDRPVTLLFRSDMVRFHVAGPAGSIACGSTRTVGSPLRELYSTVGAKGRASVSVLLTATCPRDTFDAAGIYRVTPVLDTSGASGRGVGLKTFDAAVNGDSPLLLRVRSPRRPATGPTRPALD